MVLSLQLQPDYLTFKITWKAYNILIIIIIIISIEDFGLTSMNLHIISTQSLT